MAFISLVSLLLMGILMTGLCFSADPSITQVDLVFPRNNSVYRPVYPFPIVFALHNFSSIWSYKPILNWRLLVRPPDDVWHIGETGSMGWTRYTQPTLGTPADVTMGINRSDYVGDGHRKEGTQEWKLEWEFRMDPQPNDCTGPGYQSDTGATNRSTASFFTGRISFNISNTTGIMPDLASGNACSVPLGAVGYLGRNVTDSRCPVLTWPRPNPTPCAFIIDGKAAEQVSQAMANSSHCKGAKWPSLTKECPTANSAVSKVEWSPFMILFPVLLFSLCFG